MRMCQELYLRGTELNFGIIRSLDRNRTTPRSVGRVKPERSTNGLCSGA